MTLEEVVPKTRALDGLQSAIIAVIGSTHELALLRLAPRDLTVSFREIESGEMEDLQEAVANFWANLATYQLRSANDAREQAPATAILEGGREVMAASDGLLARLPVIERGHELVVARQRLEAAEDQVVARLREARAHERAAALAARNKMSSVIDRSVRMQALAVVITLVMMAGAGLAVAGTIIRPLDHLTKATERVATGDFDLGRAAAAAGRDRSPAGFLPAHGGGPCGLARACAASGAARCADRPAEPGAAGRASGPVAGAGAALWRGRGGAGARPRPVQGDQRHAWPRCRRPAAARGGGPPAGLRARDRHGGPGRRRRVRAGAARCRAAGRSGGPVPAPAGDALGPGGDRGQGGRWPG